MWKHRKKFYQKYRIVTRGFHGARMLSEQLDAQGIQMIPDYDSLKKAYSIGICMNALNHIIGNTISEYRISKGSYRKDSRTEKACHCHRVLYLPE